MLRRAGFASSAAAAAGAAYGTYQHQTDEGFARACTLYSKIGPVVVHYRYVEARQQLLGPAPESSEATAEWRALDAQYATGVVRTLESLQGMYTKYGQIAAGLNNTFSAVWIEELRRLEDQVPPRPVEVVRATIEEATGKPVEETFSSLDPEPLGSASIGQVHRATLKKDGSSVAVKLQYPEAASFFRQDMATIRSFFKIAAPEQLITLGELERNFELEFDYKNEARNLTEVGRNMERHGFAPREVVVPAPRPELCTGKMLVMDLIPGGKLLDGLRRYAAVVAKQRGTTVAQLEEEQRKKIDTEGVPPRYDGPSAEAIERYLKAARAKDSVVNAAIRLHNAVVAPLAAPFLPSPPSSSSSSSSSSSAPPSFAWLRPLPLRKSALPPNAPRMMDLLMRVHGTQLLVDGCFNADTHAGNFLMMDDDRIALIDYGATKRLTEKERLTACCLYAALGRRDADKLVQLATAGGYKSKKMDKDVIVSLLRFGNDTMGRDLMGDMNAQQFMDDLKARDPYEEVADNLIMAGFMSFRIRIVGLALNHPVVCSDWWGKIGEAELEKAGVPYGSWDFALMKEMASDVRIAKSE